MTFQINNYKQLFLYEVEVKVKTSNSQCLGFFYARQTMKILSLLCVHHQELVLRPESILLLWVERTRTIERWTRRSTRFRGFEERHELFHGLFGKVALVGTYTGVGW